MLLVYSCQLSCKYYVVKFAVTLAFFIYLLVIWLGFDYYCYYKGWVVEVTPALKSVTPLDIF